MRMKNLLKLISAISLFSLTTATTTACSSNGENNNSDGEGKHQIENPIVDIDKNPKLTEVIFNDIISDNVINFNVPLKTNKSNGELSAVLTKQLKAVFEENNVILPNNFGVTFTDMVNQNQLNEGINNWESDYLKNKGNSYIILTSGLDKTVKVNAKYTVTVAGVENPIVDIKDKTYKMYENYYESLTDMGKRLFDAAAKAKNMTNYQLFWYLVNSGEITIKR